MCFYLGSLTAEDFDTERDVNNVVAATLCPRKPEFQKVSSPKTPCGRYMTSVESAIQGPPALLVVTFLFNVFLTFLLYFERFYICIVFTCHVCYLFAVKKLT